MRKHFFIEKVVWQGLGWKNNLYNCGVNMLKLKEVHEKVAGGPPEGQTSLLKPPRVT